MSVAIVPSRPISYDKNPIIGLARMQEKTARIIDNMLYYQCYSGNDPFLPMSGPLPPHSPVGRIVLERDPLPSLCKCVAHHSEPRPQLSSPCFQSLSRRCSNPAPPSNSDLGSGIPDWHR